MKTCGDEAMAFDGKAKPCNLRAKHREEHTDGQYTWAYFCEVCSTPIKERGRCQKCRGEEIP